MMALTNLLSLQNQPTPDTSGYMVAGYIVIFVVMLLYLVSIFIRNRNLKMDYDTLEELEKIDAEKKGLKSAQPLETLEK